MELKKITWKTIGMMAVGLLMCALFFLGILLGIFMIIGWYMDKAVKARKELDYRSEIDHGKKDSEIFQCFQYIQWLKTSKTEKATECPVLRPKFKMAMLLPVEPLGEKLGVLHKLEWVTRTRLRPHLGDGTRNYPIL